jgi:hypothetical protein
MLTRIDDVCVSSSPPKAIALWQSIEVFAHHCMEQTDKLSSVTFETDSQLKPIEEQCFLETALTSIAIQRSVDHHVSSCFMYLPLETLTF